MTRSATWTRILVDVLGRPVGVAPTPNVSARGAYLCASTAIGEFASLDEAAQSIDGTLKTAEPDPRSAAEYADHYERWSRAGQEMRALSLD
jgi:xylulokinase